MAACNELQQTVVLVGATEGIGWELFALYS
jgi:hypothetical protein